MRRCARAPRRCARHLGAAERPDPATPRSGQRRQREPNHKRRIVAERGYVNLELTCEDVAEFTYRPASATDPTE